MVNRSLALPAYTLWLTFLKLEINFVTRYMCLKIKIKLITLNYRLSHVRPVVFLKINNTALNNN